MNFDGEPKSNCIGSNRSEAGQSESKAAWQRRDFAHANSSEADKPLPEEEDELTPNSESPFLSPVYLGGGWLLGRIDERLAPEMMVGDYQLIERVGDGGYGVVWKARHCTLDRIVALKISKFRMILGDGDVGFVSEAQSLANLRHPHIVRVYEVDEWDGDYFIASDFIQGETLERFLKDKPLLPLGEAVALFEKIADAVGHAHASGVVHRDIKPGNIMIDTEGSPCLVDFGVAKMMSGENSKTADGAMVGTPAYMSPEQAMGNGKNADARSDVYALGLLLFELLTGERPFRGTSEAIQRQTIESPPPFPRSLNPKIPKDLETIILKCLEKAPDHRFNDARAVADEVRRYMDGRPLTVRSQGPVSRFIRWYSSDPKISQRTAGTIFVIVGMMLLCWSIGGFVVVSFGVVQVDDRAKTIREILASITFLEIPAVLLGWLTLRRHRWALWLSLLISSISSCLCFAASFGLTYTGQQFSETGSEMALFHLLGVITAGGSAVVLSAIVILLQHESRDRECLKLPSKDNPNCPADPAPE